MEILGADGQKLNVDDNGKVTLKIDGVEKQFTVTELMTLASKAGGADAKFQEASAIRGEAQKQLRLNELNKTAETNDDAFRELGRLKGVDSATVEARLQEYREYQREQSAGTGDEEEEEEEEEAPKKKRAEVPVVAKMSDEDKGKLDQTNQWAMEQAKEKALGEMRKTIDNDPVLGKLSSGQKEHLLDNVMSGAVIGRLQQGQAFGPTTLAAALQDTKAAAGKLGILPDATRKIESQAVMLEKAGINLGPADSPLSTAVQTGKVPVREPMSSVNYEDNLLARTLLNQEQQAETKAPAE